MFARKRDWYVFEWRNWTTEAMTNHVYQAPNFGFDDLMLRAHQLKVTQRFRTSATMTHESGATCSISQTVFEDVNAARLFFRKQAGLVHLGTTFCKIYLWRTVATSRRKAVVLPPTDYGDREGELLLDYPRLYARPMPTE